MMDRNRDCIVLVKGDTIPVTVSTTLVETGWKGGQGVQWSNPTKDEFTVTASDGFYAGFLLWGSDETSDKFTGITLSQPTYKFATLGIGGWIISTGTFERYTYASRTGPGPLVPISYTGSDRLLFSLRGYFTIEDEWTLSGDPRAPNTYYIAYVSQAPTAQNNYYLTIQTSL